MLRSRTPQLLGSWAREWFRGLGLRVQVLGFVVGFGSDFGLRVGLGFRVQGCRPQLAQALRSKPNNDIQTLGPSKPSTLSPKP